MMPAQNGLFGVALALCVAACELSAQQPVFLDFDAETGGTEHAYTAAERAMIKTRIEAIYEPWDFTFSLAPPAGTYATLFFNKTPASGAAGLADEIDFRNVKKDGTVAIDVNSQIDGMSTAEDVAGVSAFVAAHELGHLVGLRHGDSFGPIGFGIFEHPLRKFDPTLGISAADYSPAYPGPTELAFETTDHVMVTAALAEGIIDLGTDFVFSERSAVKLEFNESGSVVAEFPFDHSGPATAQPLTLATMSVPNTLKASHVFSGDFLFADAVAVTGSLGFIEGPPSEEDWYSFEGFAGDLFNFEVMATQISRLASFLDPEIEIWMDDGFGSITPVPYYGDPLAFNDNEFEAFPGRPKADSILIDLVLPVDNTYYIRVSGVPPDDFDPYELFAYRFYAVPIPEPTTFILGVMAILCLTMSRAHRLSARPIYG